MATSPRVPPLPGAHQQALRLLSDGSVDVSEITRVVEADPGFSAAVISAANSARSSPVKRVTHPRDAIVRVGVATAQRVMASMVMRAAWPDLSDTGLDSDGLWERGLAVAILCEAAMTNPRNRGDAFTAGMLHDIGILLLASHRPDLYKNVVALVMKGADVIDVERQAFGIDHAALGYAAARAWELPFVVQFAIRDHHSLEPVTSHDVPFAVREAVLSADELGIADGFPPRPGGLVAGEEPAAAGIERLRSRIAWYKAAAA